MCRIRARGRCAGVLDSNDNPHRPNLPATANYDSESESYNKVIPPYEREIYVITMIKIKITEHCDKLAKGEASVFGQ